MYQFREVTKENFEEVISIKTKDEQSGFLESNLYSLAQAKVDESLIPKAIYYNNELIGFALYNIIDNRKAIFLKRYMIDEKYQGKGHGKKALIAIIDYFKSDYEIKFLELMHYPNNIIASHLYQNSGFEQTGEIRDTEIVRRYYY